MNNRIKLWNENSFFALFSHSNVQIFIHFHYLWQDVKSILNLSLCFHIHSYAVHRHNFKLSVSCGSCCLGSHVHFIHIHVFFQKCRMIYLEFCNRKNVKKDEDSEMNVKRNSPLCKNGHGNILDGSGGDQETRVDGGEPGSTDHHGHALPGVPVIPGHEHLFAALQSSIL